MKDAQLSEVSTTIDLRRQQCAEKWGDGSFFFFSDSQGQSFERGVENLLKSWILEEANPKTRLKPTNDQSDPGDLFKSLLIVDTSSFITFFHCFAGYTQGSLKGWLLCKKDSK